VIGINWFSGHVKWQERRMNGVILMVVTQDC
jgi:hypothetical protein